MARIGVNAGVVQDATIREVNLRKGTVRVSLDLAKSDAAHSVDYVIPIPASWSGPNGEFSGGSPAIGASVRIAQGQGGRWAIVGYTLSDSSLGSNTSFLLPYVDIMTRKEKYKTDFSDLL